MEDNICLRGWWGESTLHKQRGLVYTIILSLLLLELRLKRQLLSLFLESVREIFPKVSRVLSDALLLAFWPIVVCTVGHLSSHHSFTCLFSKQCINQAFIRTILEDLWKHHTSFCAKQQDFSGM